MTEARGGLEAVRQAIIALLGGEDIDLSDLRNLLSADVRFPTDAAISEMGVADILALLHDIPAGDVPANQPQTYPRWWRLWAQDLAAKVEEVRLSSANALPGIYTIQAWVEAVWNQGQSFRGTFDFWKELWAKDASIVAVEAKLEAVRLQLIDNASDASASTVALLDSLALIRGVLEDLLECCQNTPTDLGGTYPEGACPGLGGYAEMTQPYYIGTGNGQPSTPYIVLFQPGAWVGGVPDLMSKFGYSTVPSFGGMCTNTTPDRSLCIAYNLRPEWRGQSWKVASWFSSGASAPNQNQAVSFAETDAPFVGNSGQYAGQIMAGTNQSGSGRYWYGLVCEYVGAEVPTSNPGVWFTPDLVPA